MPEFMLLLRGGSEAIQHASPEQLQQHVNTYVAWIERLIAQGQFKSASPWMGAVGGLRESKATWLRTAPSQNPKKLSVAIS